jgi:uncharacterized membrane protein YidH (DUF202 family)
MNGLQAERTVLAWWRTTLAVVATAVLIARTADAGAERWIAVPLAIGGVVLVVASAMRRRWVIMDEAVTAPSARAVAGLLAGVAALSAAGVAVVV